MLEMIKINLIGPKQCIQCKWRYYGGAPYLRVNVRTGTLGNAGLYDVDCRLKFVRIKCELGGS